MAAFALALAGVGAAGIGLARADADSHDISIVDFEYKPASVTVFTGEPVTWTNEASQAHTVTADDGSFDSGSPGSGRGIWTRLRCAGNLRVPRLRFSRQDEGHRSS